jgi:hypothetical protein
MDEVDVTSPEIRAALPTSVRRGRRLALEREVDQPASFRLRSRGGAELGDKVRKDRAVRDGSAILDNGDLLPRPAREAFR